MRAYIVTTFLGVLAADENKKIIFVRPFLKEPKKMAEMLKFSEIEILDEEKAMMQQLWKRGFKEFIFSVRKTGVKHAEPNNDVEKFLRENIRKIAVERKLVKDQTEFNQLLTSFNIELAKVEIKKAVTRDNFVIQANGAIEEIDKNVNILSERLREWYGLHFPEMDRVVGNHEKYAKLVEKFGLRNNIDDSELNVVKEKSMGAEMNEDDVKIIQNFASRIIELYRLRLDLSKYIEKNLKEIAPNFTEIATPMLAAKLIAKAGGMDKIAKMASSTIQLIGAERALFRYLHGKGKSPKFGILFNHPLIQNVPEKMKGKVARLLASKLSIAAKMDYYSKKYVGDKLKEDLNKKIKEISKS
jgi:nucleolar protein 56